MMPLLLTASNKTYKAQAEGEAGVSHIINLISYDVDAIESAHDIVLLCIAVPLEIAIATTFLYKLIEWSAFAGLAVMILSLSLPTTFSHKMIHVQQNVMEQSDRWISMISEYLS
jgi:ABC-type transport system involved in cytochrome bd biosynthesis fused ATPase/permease subunit